MPKVLSAMGGDGKQAVRLRRFLLAMSAYAICFPILFFAYAIGLIALAPLLITLTASVAANLVFFLIFRSGFNLRFEDPSLTWLQTTAASIVLLYAVYSFDSERGLALLMCVVVLMFGVFRFTTREYFFIALQFLAGYALVINLLMFNKPQTVNVYVEWFLWFGLACTLLCFAIIGGRVSELRQHLRRSNEELSTALVTIQQMATHDSLTGLPNRAMFNEALQHALAQGERHNRELAVLFMDLDRFKNINDTLGHHFGDRVLQEAARRLASCVRDSDIVARLGGDEFVLLVEEYGVLADLEEIAKKLLTVMAQPAVIDGHELNLSVSIGICTFPDDGRDAQTLLSNADIAMYRAKEQGRNTLCFYSAQINSNTLGSLAMEAGLRRALERDEFRIYYQPKIDIAAGHVTGVEALLRWQHPDLGLLLPDRFIRLAEETGLIVGIGLWTLTTVCTRAKAWQSLGMAPLPVAVNLSAREFHQENLAANLAEILKTSGLAPGLLELEITESMVMRNPEQAVKLMEKLRNMGVRIAIDDFGTGYSSLSYLKRFPINSLKVDQSFVRDLPHNRDDVAITRAVIAMAHSLQMNVIAEGVEHQAQFDLLHKEGCDEFQGYFCRPPMGEEELIRFIKSDRTAFSVSPPAPAG